MNRPTGNQAGVERARRHRERIVELIIEHGDDERSPSRAELAEMMGLSLSTVERYVRILLKDGVLEEDSNHYRSLRLK